MTFEDKNPQTGQAIVVTNMLTLPQFAALLTNMVKSFVEFPPLGVVLVALLGVGVAERAGFINAVLKSMLDYTPKKLLTPMVILVAIVSHTAADAGYVLVIQLAGLMFYAAGRHPLAGIAAAFAGVSGGFSANFVPSGIDPLLSGLTEVGAKIYDPNYTVNPLCNWYFTAISSFVIVGLGWLITDYLIEPKLANTPINGDPDQIPEIAALTPRDRIAMFAGLITMILGIVGFTVWAIQQDSSLRDPLGSLTSYRNTQSSIGLTVESIEDRWQVTAAAPGSAAAAAGLAVGDTIVSIGGKPIAEIMSADKSLEEQFGPDKPVIVASVRSDQAEGAGAGAGIDVRTSILTPKSIPGAPLISSIVPLIFVLFFFPGIVHGYISGNFKNHRHVIAGMAQSMESMAYYLVLVFFVALFIYVFNRSGIGLLLAVRGAEALRGNSPVVIICGIVLLTASVNLLVGSASAKWAMLAPIFVPMLMELGISPEFAQAAYRVGDSTTNIITPLLPYFPLVVVFGQRYYKETGIGTITSLMLPYSVCFLILWTLFLLLYWQIGIPLGIGNGYEYVKVG